MKLNIIIAGVGGQGTLLAARVLGRYAMIKGLDCKLSEVHGMAQRGGNVVSYVKIAEKVYSPLIEEGEADAVVAFEMLEAQRWIHYIAPHGKLIVNRHKIMPLTVMSGLAEYPIEIEKSLPLDTIFADANDDVLQLKLPMAVNTIMLAVLSNVFSLDKDAVKQAIEESVKQRFLDDNLKAFEYAIKKYV